MFATDTEGLTEQVGDSALSAPGDDGPDNLYSHDRDIAWLTSCDLVIANF